jgi:hypothetical protein
MRGFVDRVYFVLSIVLCTELETLAQISSEASDQHFIVGARAGALADALTSDNSDVSAMYWNPAIISFLHEISIVGNYSLEILGNRDNIMTENVVFPVFSMDWGGVAIGFTNSHVGHIEQGSPLTGYNFSLVGLDVGGSVVLSDPLSVGVLVSTRYARTNNNGLVVLSSTFGVCYQPAPELTYGLSFQGVGDGAEFVLDPLTLETMPERFRLSKALQLGITARVGAFSERPVIIANAGTQKLFGRDGIVYKGGIEIWPVPFWPLRIGYWVGSETVAARYGTGLRFGRYQLDYGISTTRLEPRFHQFSLSYTLSDHKVNR